MAQRGDDSIHVPCGLWTGRASITGAGWGRRSFRLGGVRPSRRAGPARDYSSRSSPSTSDEPSVGIGLRRDLGAGGAQ
eukprot:1598326-Prymnesium_polylepis.2